MHCHSNKKVQDQSPAAADLSGRPGDSEKDTFWKTTAETQLQRQLSACTSRYSINKAGVINTTSARVADNRTEHFFRSYDSSLP
jgi:hypothetical protein